MCIFCGGQCGGLGEFLISLGLPFLALYFFRLKQALKRIKNKLFHRGSGVGELPEAAVKCSCCGELLQNCREIPAQAIDPKNLELMEIGSQHKEPTENLMGITRLNESIKLGKKPEPKGVRGWLLLFCLILTVFLPTSYLYEAISTLQLTNSPMNYVMLLMSKKLFVYHMIFIGTLGFLAAFSFYVGLQLWEVKAAAVKITKIFLIIQLCLTVFIVVLWSFMAFFVGSENILGLFTKTLIPSLLHFSFWYLYLSYSRRVHNTYNEIVGKRLITGQIPA
jgi:hypothetical protein